MVDDGPGSASLATGAAEGEMPLSLGRSAFADATKVTKKMRVSSTTKLALRLDFASPLSSWRFIHDRVQFTPLKVHIRCGEARRGGPLHRIHGLKTFVLAAALGV